LHEVDIFVIDNSTCIGCICVDAFILHCFVNYERKSDEDLCFNRIVLFVSLAESPTVLLFDFIMYS